MRHFIAGGPKYGGMNASMIGELKSLQEENRRLKKMYAEVQLQREILQEAMRKKW
jgi:putative transposase